MQSDCMNQRPASIHFSSRSGFALLRITKPNGGTNLHVGALVGPHGCDDDRV